MSNIGEFTMLNADVLVVGGGTGDLLTGGVRQRNNKNLSLEFEIA